MTETPREQRTNPPIRFLRLPEVLERTGLSRSTIYVRLAEGRFPRPVRLGDRPVGWIEAEIDEWVRERIAESRFGGGRAGERVEAALGIGGASRRASEASRLHVERGGLARGGAPLQIPRPFALPPVRSAREHLTESVGGHPSRFFLITGGP